MRLPILEENYVTFKLINQNDKNQLLSEYNIIDKPISILDLMDIIHNSIGVLYQVDETVASSGIVSPRLLFNNDRLFMTINYHGYRRFISATNYDHAMDIYIVGFLILLI